MSKKEAGSLIRDLERPSIEGRRRAIEELSQFDPMPQRVIKALADFLVADRTGLGRLAAQGLLRQAPATSATLREIIVCGTDSCATICLNALMGEARPGMRLEKALLERLHRGGPVADHHVMSALASLASVDRKVLDKLVDALGFPRPDVQLSLLWAICERYSRHEDRARAEGHQILGTILPLRSSPHPEVRDAAEYLCGLLGVPTEELPD